jgi:hypothetical protein
MENIRKLFCIIFSVLIFMTGETGAVEKKAEMSSEKTKIVAYYFHTTYRCPSCTKIEKWSYEAIKTSFPKALEEDRLVWKVINVDEPENKHFVKEYNLYTKSLIISEVIGEKQVKWKNMDKVWQLLRNQEKFVAYVTHGVKEYLEK